MGIGLVFLLVILGVVNLYLSQDSFKKGTKWLAYFNGLTGLFCLFTAAKCIVTLFS